MKASCQSGAFDGVTANRAQLFDAVEKSHSQFGQHAKTHFFQGQSSPFESSSGSAPLNRFPHSPRLNPGTKGKSSHGKGGPRFLRLGHPLRRFSLEMAAFATAHLGNPSGVKTGSMVRAGGIVSALKKKVDKKGNMMAFVTLEEFQRKG